MCDVKTNGGNQLACLKNVLVYLVIANCWGFFVKCMGELKLRLWNVWNVVA